MMARLLDDVASRVAPGGTESSKPPQHIATRRLSFKTRQSSTVARPNYRTTKVSLSSTNVAVIASKFNTIVIDDGPQGRALLRKLSQNQRKTNGKEVKRTSKKDGVVKAAIEMFEQQESEKTNTNKPSLKRGNDFRPKLVVVRKSSTKALNKSEDLQSIGIPSKLGSLSEESTKDSYILSKDSNVITAPKIEMKVKPSIKAKPNLRQILASKQEKDTSLNQRIAKFNKTNYIAEHIEEEKMSVTNQEFVKPNFSLNDRIAQFNKNDEANLLEKKKNVSRVLVQDKPKLIRHSEEKENIKDPKKSILRNSKETSNVDVTNGGLVTNTQQNTNMEGLKPHISGDKKHSMKNKFVIGENKDLKVFQSMPDIIKSAEIKSEAPNNLKSKEFNNDCINLAHKVSDNSRKHSENSDDCIKNMKSIQKPARGNIETIKDISSTGSLVGAVEIKSSNNSSNPVLKSVLKPYAPESPNIETKVHCSMTDSSCNMQSDKIKFVELDKIKPNSSFLWKQNGGINLITEVPIYDDRPENKSDFGGNDTVDNYKTEAHKCISECDNILKPMKSDNFEIASSFSLEMTEQIDKSFSNRSVRTGDVDYSTINSPPSFEPKENAVKNPSFLYGKSKRLFASKASLKQDLYNDLPLNDKPDLVQINKETSFNDKPLNIINEVPPKLPDKKHKSTTTSSTNLNPSPPPIPPPHTKPKQFQGLIDEHWISDCKKILEIPPPLRKQHKEHTLNERPPGSVIEKQISIADQHNAIRDKRFSVSQVELLRKMSEMNLNKWNSLPSETFNQLNSDFTSEEGDHYTSIQLHEKESSDDQDSYEMIGENSYAEIAEFKDYIEEENNIYHDVEQEQEDHYEAIGSITVQHGDSDSSCDLSNSLYGVTRPTSTLMSGATYQSTGGSETSDEWVDLDNSDDQHESILIYRENDRGRGLAPTESWSMKVRRQWSRKAVDGKD